MLVTAEFHLDCSWRSVSRFQTVVSAASIDFVTAIASRNVVRVTVAFPFVDSSAIAIR